MDITLNITLDFDTLYETVARSLSIIGKRSTDDNGNLLFKDITLGSREKEIVSDFFRQAVIDLSAELSGFITTASSASVTFTLALPENHNAALDPFIRKSCEAYCVSYALASWFVITAPRIADKYAKDCTRQVSAVIRLVYEKKAPTAPQTSPLDISTEVVTDEPNNNVEPTDPPAEPTEPAEQTNP